MRFVHPRRQNGSSRLRGLRRNLRTRPLAFLAASVALLGALGLKILFSRQPPDAE